MLWPEFTMWLVECQQRRSEQTKVARLVVEVEAFLRDQWSLHQTG
jgi:hypothetical protein